MIEIALAALGVLSVSTQDTEVPLPARVNHALAKGVELLRSHQRPDGSWAGWDEAHPGGMTALAALTLRRAGVAPSDPDLERALAVVAGVEWKTTYSAAVFLMLAQALGEERWRAQAEQALALLESTQTRGVWAYPTGEPDLSNTQFALLGLRAAHHLGLDVSPQVLGSLAKALGDYQEDSGGFRYAGEHAATGGMGAATLAGYAALEEIAGGVPAVAGALRKAKRSRRRAEDWLAARFHPARNPHGDEAWTASWYHAYAWAIERYGGFVGVDEIGGRDWYAEIATHLVDSQHRDGGFGRTLADACFALLFLRRSSISGEFALGEIEAELEQLALERDARKLRAGPDCAVLEDWLVAGPWSDPGDHSAVRRPPFAPRKVRLPTSESALKRAKVGAHAWERVRLDQSGWTNLEEATGRSGEHLLWALGVWLEYHPDADEPQTASCVLWLTVEDPVSVWLDGEKQLESLRVASPIVEDLHVPLVLDAGRHVLLVLAEDDRGASAFGARLSDAQGAAPPAGVSFGPLPVD